MPALVAVVGVLLTTPLAAQRPLQPASQPAPVAAPAARWSLDVQYLHVGAAPLGRQATRSTGLTLGADLGRIDGRRPVWRAEAGWQRATRPATTAQGVTLGLSLGIPVWQHAAGDDDVAARLTLRPGLAALAGWAESQGGESLYRWRGVDGTPWAGQTGTAVRAFPVRGRTTGAGLSLAADLALWDGAALTASVRHWAFGGAAAAPNRRMTLAGVGLALRPAVLGTVARRWWQGGYAAPAAPVRMETAR